MKQIINTKKQTLAEMEKAKRRLDKLKNLLLEQQEKRDNLEAQVEFLAEDTRHQLTICWAKYLTLMRSSMSMPQR